MAVATKGSARTRAVAGICYEDSRWAIRWIGLVVVAACLLIPTARASSIDDYLASLRTTRVLIGDHAFLLWVADSQEARHRGLKHVPAELLGRTADGLLRGMLFVYGEEGTRTFWTLDTPAALDIAFVSRELEIVEVQTMAPNSRRQYSSGKPIQYVIEVAAGAFARLDIGVGEPVRLELPVGN